MFKNLQHKQSNPSFQFVTPNSRTIPTTPSKDTYQTIPMGNQPRSQYKQPSTRISSLPYDSLYDTYGDGRESLIDPKKDVSPPSGTSRQTYIEPNKSTMVQTSVTPISMYQGSSSFGNMDFFQSTSDMASMAESDAQIKRPPTIIQPRVQHVEMPVKIEQVNAPYAQASHAIIEKASNHDHFYRQRDDYNDFILQPVPSRSTHSTSSSTSSQSKSSRHPQPLPPLVIPPTPNRSVSSPNKVNNEHISPLQRSPLPSQLTPSLTPGSYGYSPMTVSPGTPSSTKQYLQTSMSPSAHEYQQKQHYPVSPGRQPSTPVYQQQQQPYPSTPRQQQQQQQQQASIGQRKKEAPTSEGEALLLEGIKYHESGKLEQATYYFQKAAQLQLPMAMFFYGVSLRHGWGCQKNEQVAFQYIQKAAEHAVLDLNSLSKTVNTSVSKGELIMAIYEMGVSFRHGWGCRKNKETAVYFFKIAADLGDADAQNDLGHCYYNGQGVKKDVALAAKYYRKADKQGHGIMGNSWIWKKKYDPK
ncbi:uncharacterized protein BX664DRAFT_360657 [Halteromyces radiatus]|uniref:uncharacterized protein n=1 Tax=Halteromyces radiatus TaxID=101107 RepID=UPI002220A1A7|nr:uncharacterized protein BX664DRAFT_360657 [Halteromyces radiatus]KAI8084830.1 hypothetical protein BX664DRAFT_360657 [Halteromyces radiatus]